MANVIFRTLILFISLLLMLRLMGKRQIGQLQPYEFSLTLIAADLVTVPMSNMNTPLLWGIIPIYVLLAAGLILSLISLKSIYARHIICGCPKVLIDKGIILEHSLHSVRYTLSDLLEQLRSKDITDISTVYYAMLETNGEISVILKNDAQPLTKKDMNISQKQTMPSLVLIMDGAIQRENLVLCTEKQLLKWVSCSGLKPEEVLLLTYDGEKVFIHSHGKNPTIKEFQCAIS